MKHFQDEEYDSMKEYETNTFNRSGYTEDYDDRPIIRYDSNPDDWYEETIKHFQD